MAGMKPRAGSYLDGLELQLPLRKNTLDTAPNTVLSPITELAKNLENSLGRTPKRKLSLSGNDCLTPKVNGTFQRSLSTTSNESGYCPDSPPPGFDFDSPSMEVLRYNAEKRRQRRPSFKRWHSVPVKSGEDPAFSANKENIGLNFDTEKDDAVERKPSQTSDTKEFKFAQPKQPVGCRGLPKSSSSSLSSRSFSDPSPQAQSKGFYIPSSPSDSRDSGTHDFDFEADGDDDGFIDDLVEEQSKEDDASQMPSGITDLVSAPLVSTEGDEELPGSGDTPKASGPGYKPRDLFNAGRNRAYTVASESPTKERCAMRQRSKSFALKRPNPRQDQSPNLRKKLRQRCMSVIESSANHPSLLEMEAIFHPVQDASSAFLRRSQSATFEHHEDLGNMLDASGQKNVVGDFSGPYTLPSIPGQHEDLKCLTPETVARVLEGEYPDVEAHIIDCRYPYEYEGGHIKGAVNIYTKEDMLSEFIEKPKKSLTGKKTILIFHCEFSSKRGPDMSRFLRNKDRDLHMFNYPELFYPELYLIEGGYKAFFSKCKEYCEPQSYLPMIDENFSQELKRFSKRSKSEGNILTKGFRPGLGYRC